MHKTKLFLIIGIFWIVLFGGFIGYSEYTRQAGTEILLRTRPVDPRDLFRGDYVILRYDISEFATYGLKYQASDFDPKDKIYVLLNISPQRIATLSDIDIQKPSTGVFLQGTVVSSSKGWLQVEYGIESYFVPEGRGKEIENNLGNIFAKLAVNSLGKALIKSLVLDGQEIELD
jgi:uncharacterized membrane-anchored protein